MRIIIAMLWIVCAVFPVNSWGQAEFRLNLEREMRSELPVAVVEFEQGESSASVVEYAVLARSVLENDLRISGFFRPIDSNRFAALDKAERGLDVVDYQAWRKSGAQWLVKTKIESNDEEGLVTLSFRVFDVESGMFLLGKMYRASNFFLRRMAHRFADEMVLQLTGKRGVADSRIVYLKETRKKKVTRGGEEGVIPIKEVFVIDFDSHNEQQLTHDETINLSPSWAPDGKWVSYTTYYKNNPNLVMINTEGKRVRKILRESPGLNSTASWAPDGKRIAMTLSKDQNSEIYIITDEFKEKRLTANFNIDTSPDWSPDGKRIVFTSDRSGAARPQVYVMSADKGEKGGLEKISSGSNYNDDPAWSPDGDHIAYSSMVGDKMQIKVFDMATRMTRQLTSGNEDNQDPSWSPDGRYRRIHKSARKVVTNLCQALTW